MSDGQRERKKRRVRKKREEEEKDGEGERIHERARERERETDRQSRGGKDTLHRASFITETHDLKSARAPLPIPFQALPEKFVLNGSRGPIVVLLWSPASESFTATASASACSPFPTATAATPPRWEAALHRAAARPAADALPQAGRCRRTNKGPFPFLHSFTMWNSKPICLDLKLA